MSLYGPTEYAKSLKRDELMKDRMANVDIDEICEAIANFANPEFLTDAVARSCWSYFGKIVEVALRQWWTPAIERDVRIWEEEQEEAERTKYDTVSLQRLRLL